MARLYKLAIKLKREETLTHQLLREDGRLRASSTQYKQLAICMCHWEKGNGEKTVFPLDLTQYGSDRSYFVDVLRHTLYGDKSQYLVTKVANLQRTIGHVGY